MWGKIDAGYKIQDTRCRIQDAGYRMQDAGYMYYLFTNLQSVAKVDLISSFPYLVSSLQI